MVTFRLILKVTVLPAVPVIVKIGLLGVLPVFSTILVTPDTFCAEPATYSMPECKATSTSAEVVVPARLTVIVKSISKSVEAKLTGV